MPTSLSKNGLSKNAMKENPSTTNSIPLVNRNILDGRPKGVVKEGVWVQVQAHAEEPLAVHDAEVEQLKVDEIILKKHLRLQQFQKDVQQRVLEGVKAQQDLVYKMQAEHVKKEQNIFYRSVAAFQDVAKENNRCMYNLNPSTIDASGKRSPVKNEKPTVLSKQSSDIKKMHRKAVENIMKRQLTSQTKDDARNQVHADYTALPGGQWGTSTTRDKSAVRSMQPAELQEELPNCESNFTQTVTATPAPHVVAIAAMEEGIVSSSSLQSKLRKPDEQIENNLTMDVFVNSIPGTIDHREDQDGDISFPDSQRNPPASSFVPNSIHYKSGKKREWKKQEVIPSEQLNTSKTKKIIVTRMCCNSQHERDVLIKSNHCISSVNNPLHRNGCVVVAPGVVEHQQRKMSEKSVLLCRRVFSDMERDRVRRERRRREHKCKVDRLQAEKEAERLQKEHEHDKNVHAAAAKLEQEKLAKEMQDTLKLKKKQGRIDNYKRNIRYSSALKAQIKQRLKTIKIDLPPLCCCSPSFWETDPHACANNCVFYKNIDAYVMALQSILSSLERNTSTSRQDTGHSIINLLMSDEN